MTTTTTTQRAYDSEGIYRATFTRTRDAAGFLETVADATDLSARVISRACTDDLRIEIRLRIHDRYAVESYARTHDGKLLREKDAHPDAGDHDRQRFDGFDRHGRPIRMSVPTDCDNCDGTGREPRDGTPCTECC